jgi:membrane protease YdiL (CAAX protease family)
MDHSRPSLRSANWLYLLSMVLILLLGSAMQARSLTWGLLATEFGLILLPTLLFIGIFRLAPRAVLRWRWPGLPLVALGALAGAGTWGLGIGLQGLASTVLGYAPQTGLANVPADPLNLAVFALALAVAAPLCEEPLFRGYLASAYGRYRPRVAWLAVAALFAAFHLQFQGLLGLLPIALVLGWLAQRSRSLLPAIAAHAANNGMGAALTIVMRLKPDLASQPALTVGLCGYMVVGPLVALAALWAFARQTRAAAPEPAPDVPAAQPAGVGRGAFWPLAAAGAAYVVFAGLELAMGRFPQVLARRSLQLQPAPWPVPTRLVYNLWNMANEPVGQAECTFTPQGETVAFACVTQQRQFQITVGQSQYAGGSYKLTQTGRWDAASMRLLEADLQFDGEYGGWSARVEPQTPDAPGLSLWLDDAGPVALPADVVIAAEWPWRMVALPLGETLYFGSRYHEVQLAPGLPDGQLQDSVVVVRGEEDLLTPPDEHAQAWKVSVGQQTAWYAADAPHTLLRFSDGYGVTWTVDLDSLEDAGF